MTKLNKPAKRSEAQKVADTKFEEKRKTSPRLPGTRITEEENEIMEQLYVKFDSKSEAILSAVKYYLGKQS